MTWITDKQIEIIKDTLRDVDTVTLEQFIDSRYEVGAMQRELDLLEDVYVIHERKQ